MASLQRNVCKSRSNLRAYQLKVRQRIAWCTHCFTLLAALCSALIHRHTLPPFAVARRFEGLCGGLADSRLVTR